MFCFIFGLQTGFVVILTLCRMEERCDQIMDCEDKSDENNCNLIVFEDNYSNA